MALQIRHRISFCKTKNKPETTGWLKNGLAACSLSGAHKKEKIFFTSYFDMISLTNKFTILSVIGVDCLKVDSFYGKRYLKWVGNNIS